MEELERSKFTAAGEIAKIAMQLIERKAEREDALHAFQRQGSRHALAAQCGHFDGEAILRPDLQGFDYDETGSMRFGTYEGRASQSYRWDIDAVGTLVVRFRDGRLFHALDLSSGDMAVAHLCAGDLYRGRFRLVDDVCWLSRWQVSGPRKDQLILNRYRRMLSPM